MKPDLPASPLRRRTLLTLAAVATLPALSACAPLVVGGAAATATVMAIDRRTSGAYVEDEGIEWRTRNRIRERFGDQVNVSVTSFNRVILLTGQVPNEQVREEAGQIAMNVENVSGLLNELEIGAPSSLGTRSNDALVTSNVRARFVEQRTAGQQHAKVVTENGTVFLMGIVTRAEADGITEVARTTSGVQKVVRVFEYVSDEEAARLDRTPREQRTETRNNS